MGSGSKRMEQVEEMNVTHVGIDARNIGPDDVHIDHDRGRSSILNGECSLTEWLVWDWSRQVDDSLDTANEQIFDLVDKVRYLNILIVSMFTVVIFALTMVTILALL